MPKVEIDGDNVRYRCRGCGHDHAVPYERWNWNGDVDSPTLSPSVRHFYGMKGGQITTCHYFVREGFIEYCDDCPHQLRGERVEMLDMDGGFPPEYGESVEG